MGYNASQEKDVFKTISTHRGKEIQGHSPPRGAINSQDKGREFAESVFSCSARQLVLLVVLSCRCNLEGHSHVLLTHDNAYEK